MGPVGYVYACLENKFVRVCVSVARERVYVCVVYCIYICILCIYIRVNGTVHWYECGYKYMCVYVYMLMVAACAGDRMHE